MRRVSLVVITRNRVELLRRHISHHLSSLPPGGEASDLIIVDNDSGDGTSRWVASAHPDVTLISLHRNTGAYGRNVGAARAGTRYVAFSDDDSWWEPGALEAAADFLDTHPGVGVVAGSARVGEDLSPDPINRRLAASPIGEGESGHRQIMGFLAFAAVARRDLFVGGTGFPLGLGVGSEEELVALDAASAGWSLLYLPELRAQHHPHIAGDRTGRRARYARNATAIAWARRSAPEAMAATLIALDGLRPATMARVVAMLPGALTWAARHRRVVPGRVERARRGTDDPASGFTFSAGG